MAGIARRLPRFAKYLDLCQTMVVMAVAART
ncbi:hypothetical protein SNOG_00525 [Parastagonospora nodorum SN15]|uniref:Uncharacterized protein n=1 Tax=Phaeosphaeria nodorum (strain SN15 / ATCC MYA-4574 / FGSC 10173) TaxID=321614 RepID=Q0V639_PHANO|nr:hypothetical protein SNOG_00525 [Parastagonospora nodorum SN15]EAT92020.1 hypothetical protein SNOG_00525 [Parastagonospora nodorum SN15]